MAIVAAAASPRFRRFVEPLVEQEDEEDVEKDESDDVAGSGDGLLSPGAAAAAAVAAAISEPMRSGKLRSAREPRMR